MMPEHEGLVTEVLREPGFFRRLKVMPHAQEVVKNLKPGETVKLPATVVFPDGSKKGEGIDVSVHLHGQSDDYNIEEANDDASDITTSLIGRFTEKNKLKN